MEKIFDILYWFIAGLRKRFVRINARKYSNRILKKYLMHFQGDIINVSGWEDRDKEGGFYRNYFGTKTRYVISNVGGRHGASSTQTQDIE